MKKRIISLSALLLLAGMMVFASGQREEVERPYGPRGSFTKGEKISVSGPVHFEDRHHPEIESGGVEYELLVPRSALLNIDIKEGQTVTVEGYKTEGMCCEERGENEVHLWVTKANIDGKEYDLGEDLRGRPGWRGHGGMMRGGRGPGFRNNDDGGRPGWRS
jgi:hypothetical protein